MSVKKLRPGGSMSLMGHLGELRRRVFITAGIFIAAAIAAYVFAPALVRSILELAVDHQFIQTGVAELLGQYIKISLIAAAAVSIPAALWQFDRFLSPGLTKNEHRVLIAVLISAPVLFFGGAAFCFFIVIPLTLQFFSSINTIGVLGLYSVKEYISYMVAFMLSFGAIFQVPVVSAILTCIGILTPQAMTSAQRIVIVLCFVIGAVITPPDVASQILVAVPMLLLYEFSILICRLAYSRRKKHLAAQGIDLDSEEQQRRAKRSSRWQNARETVMKEDAAS